MLGPCTTWQPAGPGRPPVRDYGDFEARVLRCFGAETDGEFKIGVFGSRWSRVVGFEQGGRSLRFSV